jgi:hypothetical protein
MFRCVVKNHVMGVVVQERSTTFHRAQDPTLAFDTQCLCRDLILLGYPTHQCCGLLDIQVIQEDVPFLRERRTSNQALQMSERILLVAGRSKGKGR